MTDNATPDRVPSGAIILHDLDCPKCGLRGWYLDGPHAVKCRECGQRLTWLYPTMESGPDA